MGSRPFSFFFVFFIIRNCFLLIIIIIVALINSYLLITPVLNTKISGGI